MKEFDWHKEIGSCIAYDLSENDVFEIELKDGRTLKLTVIEIHTVLNNETEVICEQTEDGKNDWAVYANPMTETSDNPPRYDVYAVNLDAEDDSEQIEVIRA